jgi:anti-sigma factor RsiW
MRCHERDPDLLLLMHGELSAPRQSQTEMHLRYCPRCQERHERFARISHLLAGSIGNRMQTFWSPPALRVAPRSPPPRLPWPALLTLLALVLVLAGVTVVTSMRTAATPHAGAFTRLQMPGVGSGGCRTDLPNDHCR